MKFNQYTFTPRKIGLVMLGGLLITFGSLFNLQAHAENTMNMDQDPAHMSTDANDMDPLHHRNDPKYMDSDPAHMSMDHADQDPAHHSGGAASTTPAPSMSPAPSSSPSTSPSPMPTGMDMNMGSGMKTSMSG